MAVVWRLHGDEWEVEYLNPAWENNLGWKRDQLIAQGLRSFTHPADNEKTSQALVSLLKVGSLTFANRYLHIDGSYRWLQWECQWDKRKQRIFAVARASANQSYPEDDAIITVTPGGYISGWNRLAETIFGYELWEALGELLADYFDRAHVVTDAIKSGLSLEYLTSTGRGKGDRPLNLLTSLEIHHDGRQAHGRLVVHNIDAVTHSASFLVSLMRRSQNIAKIGGWVSDVDPENGLLVWSEETFNIMGLERSDFNHRVGTFFSLVHPNDLAEVKRLSIEAFQSEQPYSIDHRIVTPAGELKWVHEEAYILRDSKNTPLQMVGTIQDITGNKLLNLALSEREAWYRAIVNNLSSIIVTMNGQGVLRYGSPSVEKILGYNATKLVGHSVSEVLLPTDHLLFKNVLATVLTQPDQPQALNIRLRTADDRWRWFEGTMVNMLGLAGVEAIVVSGSDVTDRVELEESLKAKAQALAWANEELKEFAYVASHDMKEPLRTIAVYLDVVLVQLDEIDADTREAVGFIQGGVKRINTLLDDLLTYSRVGTVAPSVRQGVNLNRLLDGVVANLRGRIEQTQGNVIVKPLPILDTDPTRLAQVFQNLISNGLKFHQPGIPPVVEVGYDEPAFYVKDNGIGIATKHFIDIFRVFVRLHSFDAYSGSGIGLATCKKIIQQHGGRIWLESQPGQGSTFYFTLGETDDEKSKYFIGGG